MTCDDGSIDLQMRRLEAMLSPGNREVVRKIKHPFSRKIMAAMLVPQWNDKKQFEKDRPAEVVDFPKDRR